MAAREEPHDPRSPMLGLLVAAPAFAGPAFAAGPPDPDWPCIQRRQPSPVAGAGLGGSACPTRRREALVDAPEVQELARTIALRRTPMADAEARIAAFAETHERRGADRAHGRDARPRQPARNRVMAGITSYAHKQEALDGRIDDTRHALAARHGRRAAGLRPDRRARGGARLVDPHLPGPPAVADLRLRDAGDPRAARLRAGAVDRGAAAAIERTHAARSRSRKSHSPSGAPAI